MSADLPQQAPSGCVVTSAPTPAESRAPFREAARAAVARAPKVRRGDPTLDDIKCLFGDFPAFVAERRNQREPGHAA